jgi:hypothetical protein
MATLAPCREGSLVGVLVAALTTRRSKVIQGNETIRLLVALRAFEGLVSARQGEARLLMVEF